MEKQIEYRMIIELVITIAITIIFYELIQIIPLENIIPPSLIEILSLLIKLISYIISIVLVIFINKTNFFVRIVEGENYISGKYEGYSISNEKKVKEIVTIKQSFMLTTISGVTSLKNNTKSTWSGRLVEKDNNKYTFYIELCSTRHISKKGICVLTKTDSILQGFYFSTLNKSMDAEIKLTKITKK